MADMYTPSDAMLEELARNRAADSAAARAATAGPIPTPPPVMPDVAPTAAKPGIISRLASGTTSLTAGALRAAPVIGGFVEGSGLTKTAPSVAPTPGTQFTGADSDVPPDFTDAQKAQMQTMPPSAAATPDNYLKRSRDGIISAFRNASMSGLADSTNALPGASGAIGAISNIARNGGRLASLGANLIGETPMLSKIGEGIGQAAVGTGFMQPPPGPLSQAAAKSATPAQSEKDRAEARVGDVIANNPQLGGTPPNNPQLGGTPPDNRQITQLKGGPFASPMFTDDPQQAIQEAGRNPIADPSLAIKGQRIGADGLPETYVYPKNATADTPGQSYGPIQRLAMGTAQQAGDRINVMPSTAASDKAFLSGAFQQHLASGDLARAAATATSDSDRAALGAAERQQLQARNAAYNAAPQERMLQDYIQSKIDADKRGIRDRAFGSSFRSGNGGNGGQAQGGAAGLDPGIIAGLQASIAASKGQQADPVAALANRQAQELAKQTTAANINNVNADADTKRTVINNLIQRDLMWKQYAAETNPDKKANFKEQLRAFDKMGDQKETPELYVPIKGLSDKINPNTQLPMEENNVLNQRTGAITSGKLPVAAAKPPSREAIIADAKAKFAKGTVKKDAINADAMAKYGFNPL